MDRKFFIPLGLLFFFIGTALILNSVSTITGLAIFEQVAPLGSSAIGIVFIVLGIFSFMLGSYRSSKNKISILD
jgi:hypothetical protein